MQSWMCSISSNAESGSFWAHFIDHFSTVKCENNFSPNKRPNQVKPFYRWSAVQYVVFGFLNEETSLRPKRCVILFWRWEWETGTVLWPGQVAGRVLRFTTLPTLDTFHGALLDSYMEGTRVTKEALWGASIETVTVIVHANILTDYICKQKRTGISNRCVHHFSGVK